MKATDLRVGSYIERYNKVHGEKDIIQVDGGTPLLAFEGMTTLKFNPIPLTEEWLLKFGFEKGKHAWFSKKYFTDCDEYAEVMKIDYNISSKRLAIYDAIEETDMVNILSHPIYTGKRVLYIHQLQNLYFALTGEELKVN